MALTVSVSELVEQSNNPLLKARAGWPRVRLGDIATVLNGYAFKSDLFTRDEGVPLIRIRDVGSDASETRYKGEFDARYLVNAGELLIGMDGDFNCARWRGEPSLLNQRVCKVTVRSKDFNDRFLDYLLPGYLNAINAATSSTTVKHLSSRSIEDMPLPFPPLAEQTEIVEEFEKQFSRLDEAVANLKRVKANLKRYKAAVLKAAVEGRLVPTEAELSRKVGDTHETGAQLLQRLVDNRRTKWNGRGKYKEPEASRAEWQFTIPPSWAWTTLGHLALSVRDGPHFSPKYSDSGIPFISGGNIRPEGIDFSNTKFISPELHEELAKRCKPAVGDLLYTKGGTTGIARINTESREFNVWVHVAVIKVSPEINPFYLQHALNSQHCYKQSQLHTHGVGNQDLGLTRMVWITVPLPPRREQDRIVAEIDRRLSIAREIELEVETNLKRAQRLRDATLASSFSEHGPL